ncbi:MAG: hypothetical protein P1U57_08250 [Oleibacter sp.]|nr:hypothetical protein [Thalassolituus sp.]
MNKLNIQESASSIARSLYDAMTAIEVYSSFQNLELYNEYDTQFDMYSQFFQSASNHAFITFIVSMHKFIDHKNSISIKDFCNKLNDLEAYNLDGKIISIDESKNSWKAIILFRQNLFGHSGFKLTEDEIYSRASVSRNDLTMEFYELYQPLIEILEILEIVENVCGSVKFLNDVRGLKSKTKLNIKLLLRNMKAGRAARLEGKHIPFN